MLTFLRKVRKSLIESGTAQKYIIYAIGEIFLVMIGILLALQVNEWRESVRERNKEVKTLELLIRDLDEDKGNIIVFKDNLELQEQGVIHSINHIKNESHKDSILLYLRDGLVIWNYRPTYPTYEGLRQSGSLDIISNHVLIDHIINYHDDRIVYFDDLRAIYKTDVQKARLAFEPYLGYYFENQTWTMHFTSKVEDLKDDIHAQNVLSRTGRRRHGLVQRIENIFLKENQELIEKLEEHLDHLKQ